MHAYVLLVATSALVSALCAGGILARDPRGRASRRGAALLLRLVLLGDLRGGLEPRRGRRHRARLGARLGPGLALPRPGRAPALPRGGGRSWPRLRRLVPPLYAASFGFLAITWFTPWMLRDMVRTSWGWGYVVGPATPLHVRGHDAGDRSVALRREAALPQSLVAGRTAAAALARARDRDADLRSLGHGRAAALSRDPGATAGDQRDGLPRRDRPLEHAALRTLAAHARHLRRADPRDAARRRRAAASGRPDPVGEPRPGGDQRPPGPGPGRDGRRASARKRARQARGRRRRARADPRLRRIHPGLDRHLRAPRPPGLSARPRAGGARPARRRPAAQPAGDVRAPGRGGRARRRASPTRSTTRSHSCARTSRSSRATGRRCAASSSAPDRQRRSAS